jgi:hypothetical protein
MGHCHGPVRSTRRTVIVGQVPNGLIMMRLALDARAKVSRLGIGDQRRRDGHRRRGTGTADAAPTGVAC